MKLLYSKSKWEAGEITIPAFAERVAEDGFDIAEIYLPGERHQPAEIGRVVRETGLTFIAHIATSGSTPAQHLASLEAGYLAALEADPRFVTAHAGRDHFAFDDNRRILEHGAALAARHGVALHHETHRGRILYTLPLTSAFLAAVPGLTLTADLSHFTCVHESDLSDQAASLEAVLRAARHIHARVGFGEGPQVADPRAPDAAPWLQRFLGFWQRIVDLRRADGAGVLTICPEFGPPPYMWTHADGRPLADAWEINVWMLRHLRKHLS